jgi:hypothetical protein
MPSSLELQHTVRAVGHSVSGWATTAALASSTTFCPWAFLLQFSLSRSVCVTGLWSNVLVLGVCVCVCVRACVYAHVHTCTHPCSQGRIEAGGWGM